MLALGAAGCTVEPLRRRANSVRRGRPLTLYKSSMEAEESAPLALTDAHWRGWAITREGRQGADVALVLLGAGALIGWLLGGWLGLIVGVVAGAVVSGTLAQENTTSGKRKWREQRRPFKQRYDLNRRQSIHHFEGKMARGMLEEDREVFVTAFCKDGHVLGVTASIGSKFRCRPSDDVNKWGQKARRLGADEIRQYHNHPRVEGRHRLSREDRAFHSALKASIEGEGVRFRTFLVYPVWLLDSPVIKEYRGGWFS